MLAVINARIVLEDRIIKNGTLLIENGKIKAFGDNIVIPTKAKLLDAKGNLVGPGFVDIHCHGGNGARFDKNPLKAAEHFLKNGTTTILATLYYDITPYEYIVLINKVTTYLKEGKGKNIGGFYMEGPYTNVKYGACPDHNRWSGKIKSEDFNDVIEHAGEYVKVWAFAPEREGIEPFIKKAKEVNPSVTFSVAHSEATPEQIKKYGITLLTHCTNATGRPPVPAGTRGCGPDEACFLDDNMYAEVICDSEGIHVNPDMLKLILKIKGKDKVVLISDCFVSDEPSPPQFAHIKDLNFDSNGDLCGSNLSLNVACRNMIKHTGISVTDAFLMGSRNPARVIGMDNEIGTIEVGKKANIVVVNDNFDVKNVILEGEIVC